MDLIEAASSTRQVTRSGAAERRVDRRTVPATTEAVVADKPEKVARSCPAVTGTWGHGLQSRQHSTKGRSALRVGPSSLHTSAACEIRRHGAWRPQALERFYPRWIRAAVRQPPVAVQRPVPLSTACTQLLSRLVAGTRVRTHAQTVSRRSRQASPTSASPRGGAAPAPAQRGPGPVRDALAILVDVIVILRVEPGGLGPSMRLKAAPYLRGADVLEHQVFQRTAHLVAA